MKNNTMRSLITGSVVVFVAMGMTAAPASTNAPYADDFESYGVGSLDVGPAWTTNGAGTVDVVSTTAAGGSKSCKLDGEAVLALNIVSNGVHNVWVDFFCRPAASDGDPAAPASSAAFCFNTNGDLRAYVGSATGDMWTNLYTRLVTNFNEWIGMSAHLSYTNQRWDIYSTSGPTGSTRRLINTIPLWMTSEASNALVQVVFSSGTTAFVDQVQVTLTTAPIVSGVPSPSNQVAGKSITVGTGYNLNTIARYFDSRTDGIMQDLGAALLAALPVGSKVNIYTGGTPVWDILEIITGPNGKTWQSNQGRALADIRITRTTGFYIEIPSGNPSEVTFEVVGSFDNANPTNPAVAIDWNLVQWPWVDQLVNTGGGLGGGFENGDRVYVEGVPGYLQYYNGKWYYKGNLYKPANAFAMPAGKAFWLKKTSAGTWVISTQP